MKAILIEKFGGPDQLKLIDVPTPEPKDNEVQIAVAYAGANPVDWKISEGLLKDRMPYEFPIILGWDVAGTISKVGKGVTNLKVGDEVFAYTRGPIIKWGTYAEYVCFDAQHVVLKPKKLSFKEAASIPLSALTAWQSLFEAAQLKSGETILIQAGAGGVGGMAIQFAKNVGAKVFTTASLNNFVYVSELGAEVAIDYKHEDFVTRILVMEPDGIDVVFDTVGGKTLEASCGVLKKGGRLVSLLGQLSQSTVDKYGIKFTYVFVRPEGKDLKAIATLLDTGKVKPPTIEEFPLSKAKEALIKLKEGHTRGKIVLKIER